MVTPVAVITSVASVGDPPVVVEPPVVVDPPVIEDSPVVVDPPVVEDPPVVVDPPVVWAEGDEIHGSNAWTESSSAILQAPKAWTHFTFWSFIFSWGFLISPHCCSCPDISARSLSFQQSQGLGLVLVKSKQLSTASENFFVKLMQRSTKVLLRGV